MITSLRLEKFGKFRGKTFRFAPVTLFVGYNESGKTTLFDALLSVLAPPKATTVPGKRLAARYGGDRLASCEYDEKPPEISAADFLNLFAVRSGEITLEIEKNSQWMNTVKASLFSGGIDPQTLLAKLDSAVKGTGKASLGGEANKIRSELENLRAELEEARVRRKECLDEEERVKDSGSRISKTAEETARIAAAALELEKTLEQQHLLREEKTLKDILFRAAERQRKKDELEKYSRYTRERLAELKKKEAAALQLKNDAEKFRALEEEARRTGQRYIEEKLRREKEKNRADSLRALAETLRGSLVPREKLITRKVLRVVRKPVLAAAAALLLAGACGALFAPSTPLKMTILGTGLVLSCLLLVFIFQHQSAEDTSGLDAALKNARERWRQETGEAADESYEAVLAVLERAAFRARAAAEDYERIAAQAADFEKEAASRAAQKKDAEEAAQAAARDIRLLLEAAGGADAADYAARLEKKENLAAQCAELETQIRAAQKTYGAASPEELQALLVRKSAEISGKITQTEISPAELRAKENELREKKARLETLRREEKQTIGDFSLNLGTVRGRMAGLPEKIVACEKSIQEKESRLAEIGRELRAARIAQEIFTEIAEDAGVMLGELSREIGASFSALTEKGREVSLKTYSTETAAVLDSGGRQRGGENLSAGTLDAFLLAARLVLARKSLDSGKKAIVVLDEPFLTLDRPRTGRALRVLEEFRKKENWQIILFTKDEETEKQARAVFGENLLVHNLEKEEKP